MFDAYYSLDDGVTLQANSYYLYNIKIGDFIFIHPSSEDAQLSVKSNETDFTSNLKSYVFGYKLLFITDENFETIKQYGLEIKGANEIQPCYVQTNTTSDTIFTRAEQDLKGETNVSLNFSDSDFSVSDKDGNTTFAKYIIFTLSDAGTNDSPVTIKLTDNAGNPIRGANSQPLTGTTTSDSTIYINLNNEADFNAVKSAKESGGIKAVVESNNSAIFNVEYDVGGDTINTLYGFEDTQRVLAENLANIESGNRLYINYVQGSKNPEITSVKAGENGSTELKTYYDYRGFFVQVTSSNINAIKQGLTITTKSAPVTDVTLVKDVEQLYNEIYAYNCGNSVKLSGDAINSAKPGDKIDITTDCTEVDKHVKVSYDYMHNSSTTRVNDNNIPIDSDGNATYVMPELSVEGSYFYYVNLTVSEAKNSITSATLQSRKDTKLELTMDKSNKTAIAKNITLAKGDKVEVTLGDANSTVTTSNANLINPVYNGNTVTFTASEAVSGNVTFTSTNANITDIKKIPVTDLYTYTESEDEASVEITPAILTEKDVTISNNDEIIVTLSGTTEGSKVTITPGNNLPKSNNSKVIEDVTSGTVRITSGSDFDLSNGFTVEVTGSAKIHSIDYKKYVPYVPTVNPYKQKLLDKIKEAEELKEEEYTAETWASLKTALENAKKVNADNATSKDVEDLDNAIKALAKISESKQALLDKIKEAEELKEEEYTAETWANLQTALENAKKVNADNATSKDVEDLDNAIKALAKISEFKQALLDKIKEAEELKEEEYTAESWANLKTALENAKKVNADNATSKDVEDLDNAIEALAKKADDSSSSKPDDSSSSKPDDSSSSKPDDSSSSKPDDSSSNPDNSEAEKPHTHTYTSVKVNATYFANGYTAKKCSCGNVTNKKTIPMLQLGAPISRSFDTSIRVRWSKATDASGYVIYLNGKKVKTVSAQGERLAVITGLTPGTEYKISVKPYKKSGAKTIYGKASKVLTTATRPEMVKFTVTPGKTSATVNWEKVKGATGYMVYFRKAGSNNWRVLKTTDSKTTSFTKTGLKSHKKYYFTQKSR